MENQLTQDMVTVHHLGPEFTAKTLIDMGYRKVTADQITVLQTAMAKLASVDSDLAATLQGIIATYKG